MCPKNDYSQDGTLDVLDKSWDEPIPKSVITELKKFERECLKRRDEYEGGGQYAVWGAWHRVARELNNSLHECQHHNKRIAKKGIENG